MKNFLFFFLILFGLSACDRSIESQLENRNVEDSGKIAEVEPLLTNNNQSSEVQKTELNSFEQKSDKTDEQGKLDNKKKEIIQTKEQEQKTEQVKDISTKKVESIAQVAIKKTDVKKTPVKTVHKAESKKSTKLVTNKIYKAENMTKKQVKSAQNLVINKEKNIEKDKDISHQVEKNTIENKKTEIAQNDGTYENGQLVSTLSPEELRVGYQHPLSQAEIQYYKSLCRYAYMSEQDVIDNRCEAKKVNLRR